jgi:hypothetical protein
VRIQALRYVSRIALAGGVTAGALVLVTSTAASAHFTCNDGSTTEIDDPAVACVNNGGVAHEGISPTTAEHDHDAETPTTKKATTPTTKAKSSSAVKATPSFTG